MQLLSINIGKEQPIRNGKKTGTSGIFKIPTDAPVRMTPLGLESDVIIDTENHGGVDQAVYVCFSPDYAWWSAELGQSLAPGTFGDNLTISVLESAMLNIGDRLHVGPCILEISAPRIPCATLAARMGDPQFVKRYRKAERPGVYCRVIAPDVVRRGDPVSLERTAGPTLGVIEMFRAFYEKDLTVDGLRRHLAAPVAIRDRKWREQQLADLLAEQSG
jgi:MOSC domain-containing protein YiiM